VAEFLKKRAKRPVIGDKAFGVVFTPTRYCNLRCNHCAVAAPFRADEIGEADVELPRSKTTLIIEKVAGFSKRRSVPVFLMFGGGEPTLRADFLSLLEFANKLLGRSAIGFCTNGTFRNWEYLRQAASYVGLLEVSLDGFENYHDKWRGKGWQRSDGTPYSVALSTVSQAAEEVPEILEVTSVVTRENMGSLPAFARFLRDSVGVRNYSVHRPVTVGRMATLRALVPSQDEYYRFFVEMARVANESDELMLHVHHSLESIYSALLLGRDIHRSSLPLASSRHSIGVSWDGRVHFDPWALVKPFSVWSAGNLLDENVEIETLIDVPGSILGLVAAASRDNVRCEQCDEVCTGGMQLLAMADYLAERKQRRGADVAQLIAALSMRDPACPLAVQ
jgi:MoaA/NifB/PqqE/SkfB family radical SAM enzyme